VRQIVSGNPLRIYAGYTNKEFYNTQIAFNILIKEIFANEVSLKYLLVLLNSNLMSYYHREKFLDSSKKLFQKILIANAKKLPVKIPAKFVQRRIEQLADAMISVTGKLYKTSDLNTDSKTRLQNQIKVLERKLNHEIYKVYGISEADLNEIDESMQPREKR
jgi:hypothetical protein